MHIALSTDSCTLYQGDSLAVLPTLPDASVDAVVTDPPYNLSFMGKDWDTVGDFQEWCRKWAGECLRVLKPGGHLIAFGGTRTYHRLTCGIEDAGFEIRDSLHWVYGSGFPKGQDVSKAIDKSAGAQREVVGSKIGQPGYSLAENRPGGRSALGEFTDAVSECAITAPATDEAVRWQGWNTALKPAHEPIVLARKPLTGTVTASVLEHGTGAIHIAACRVAPTGESRQRVGEESQDRRYTNSGGTDFAAKPGVRGGAPEGRWPSNILLGHGPNCIEDGDCQPGCPVAELDRQSGVRKSGKMKANTLCRNRSGWAGDMPVSTGAETVGDTGGASRFFPVFRYQAKAPAKERPRLPDGTGHPTVKPLSLMEWLCTLVTPAGGLVLDPFAGSGTTLQAAVGCGFRVIGVESSAQYVELCRIRLSAG